MIYVHNLSNIHCFEYDRCFFYKYNIYHTYYVTGVDDEFERLLGSIFGQLFMTRLRLERPAAYIELMLSFESRKRSSSPDRSSTLNIFLPFAFIEFHRIITGKEVSDKY